MINMAALFGALLVLAFYPGVSSLTVAARSAAFGVKHGVMITLGIVTGDLLFIFITISGLSYITQSLSFVFLFIKYLGGAYLIWLGIGLWTSTTLTTVSNEVTEASISSSYLSGFFITLADVKAIFFYLVFFPAYIDLTTLTFVQTSILIAVSISAVILAKLSYVFIAYRTRLFLTSPGALKRINFIMGSIIAGTGLYLILKP